MTPSSVWHPPCWVIAPSLGIFTGEPFDTFRRDEARLEREGFKIRIVLFDVEPKPVMGIAVFAATQRQPSDEQLARIYTNILRANALIGAPSGGTA